MECVWLYKKCMGLCGAIYGGCRESIDDVCRDVVAKATPNDRVRAEDPNEKPFAGARRKRG